MKMTVRCCVCKKIHNDAGRWIEREAIEGEIFSHGYCPECYKRALNEVEEEAELMGLPKVS